MRLPQKTEYALQAVVSLAQEDPRRAIPAGIIADRLGLPRRVVEQQFSALSKAGIVTCHRGPGGGCAIAREPSEISVAAVVEAIDGRIVEESQQRGPVTDLLSEATRAFERTLSSVTIADLAAQERRRAGTALYYI